MNNPRIIVALDYPEAAPALALARQLDPVLCRVKVGKELFVTAGPQLVDALQQMGHTVFLDLKFHDIPNTVAAACRAAARLGVWMVNVHASGGLAMMQAAREALSGHETLLIAVTVLTSMGREDLAGIGLDCAPQEQVLRLARLTQQAGLDGVVCSAREAALLRDEIGEGFLKVTPGIRPAGAEVTAPLLAALASPRGGVTPALGLPGGRGDDQKRVLTPTQALAAGAHYLVIGRPITQAADPLAALLAIHAEVTA